MNFIHDKRRKKEKGKGRTLSGAPVHPRGKIRPLRRSRASSPKGGAKP